jgi:hypothetical protein
MIRTAFPGVTGNIRSSTSRDIVDHRQGHRRLTSAAVDTSVARTAYPSIDELSKDGSGHSDATTSSASTQP